jgi:hypothetical protein
MSDEELEAKFTRQVVPGVGGAGAARLAAPVWALDQGGDARELVLTGAG